MSIGGGAASNSQNKMNLNDEQNNVGSNQRNQQQTSQKVRKTKHILLPFKITNLLFKS